MVSHFTGYAFALFVPALITAAIAGYAWRHRRMRAMAPFAVLMMAVSAWSLGYAGELAAQTFAAKSLWVYIEYTVVVVIPLSWLTFAVRYSGLEAYLSRARLIALAIVPALTLVAVYTNDLHHLFYRAVYPSAAAGISGYVAEHGPLYWVHVCYSYALLLGGMACIARLLVRSPAAYRAQSAVMLVAAAVPWIVNVLACDGWDSLGGLDLTPYAFTITGLAIVWGMRRLRLLDLVPVARDALFGAMPDGVIVIDGRGRILDLNPAAQQILGASLPEMVGVPADTLLPPWTELLARHTEAPGEPQKIPLGAPPRLRWYEARLSPLNALHGQLHCHLVFLRDITAAEDTARALRHAEVSYRELYDVVGEAVFVQDKEGRFLDVNHGATEMYGYPRERFLGATPDFLCAPGRNDMQVCGEFIRGAFHGQPQHFEFWGLRSDGTIFPEDVRLYPTTYLGRAAVIALAVDITERKRQEEALREASLRFEAVIDNAPMVAIESLDRSGRVQHWNKASEWLYGYAAPLAIGQCYPDLILSQAGAREFKERLGRIYSGEVSVLEGDWEVRRRTGEIRVVHSAMFPLYRGGAVSEVFCMDVDVTDRKRVEETQRLAAVGQLAAGVAHEFNNLLAAMLLQAELAALHDSGPARELADIVIRAATRGGETCRNLMAFARPQRLRREPLPVSRPIQGALVISRQQLENAQVRVELLDAAPEACVHGDAGQLEQVLLNLIINACHAMSAPEVPVERRVLRLETALQEDTHGQSEVVVTVADAGVGIPPDHLPHVFEPFFTTRGSNTSTAGAGAGLGLSVSHGIIAAHDGRLSVWSTPGSGACFEIRLPRHVPLSLQVGEPRDDRPAAAPAFSPAFTRLLLAEDEPDVREALTRGLTEAGYAVTAVATTDEALAALAQQTFSAVVTDLVMPGAGGAAVVRRARQLAADPAIILITGRMESSLETELELLEPDACLAKPFTIEALRSALLYSLEQRLGPDSSAISC